MNGNPYYVPAPAGTTLVNILYGSEQTIFGYDFSQADGHGLIVLLIDGTHYVSDAHAIRHSDGSVTLSSGVHIANPVKAYWAIRKLRDALAQAEVEAA